MSRAPHRVICLLLCLCFLPALSLAESGGSTRQPQVLTLWHYYNGMQQQMFDQLVLHFNETVGMEQGIVIEAISQGSVNNLTERLLAVASSPNGTGAVPDICAAYADTAYDIDQMGLVADLAPYISAEERAAYVDAYIHEGQLDMEGSLKLFPIAKSTEMLLVNQTDWDIFAAATGAQVEQLSTWEGICEVAELYWHWTDDQTDTPHDGQAFFGRDAFANYMLIGSMQLGKEIFQVDHGEMTLIFDRDVMYRLWENYAVPSVKGYFASYGRFRADDVKTGLLLALVGSTSGALYFPEEVTADDGSTYPIACMTLPLPGFAGTEPYAVQQGAGMIVKNTTPERIQAATVFLKWFTQPENNISFSLHSGYLPVTKEANQPQVLAQAMAEENVTGLLRDILETGVTITSSYHLYTNNAFAGGYEARQVLETSMPNWIDLAIQQRDELVASGMAWEEAVSRFTSEEAFEDWYSELCVEMNLALNR